MLISFFRSRGRLHERTDDVTSKGRRPGKLIAIGIILAGTSVASNTNAQNGDIQVVLRSSIEGVRSGDVAGGDLLGDGQEELIIIGRNDDDLPQTSVYRLISRTASIGRIDSEFARMPGYSIQPLAFGSVVTADLDGNNEIDVLVSGGRFSMYDPDGDVIYQPYTAAYYNFTAASEQPSLQRYESTGLPAVWRSEIAVADFDGDGTLDVVLGGEQEDGTFLMGVYLNTNTDGSGTDFVPVHSQFRPLLPTMLSTGDFDGDGDLDFVAGGWSIDRFHEVRLYENEGNASFVEHADALPDLFFPAGAFGDFDGDGDDDFLLSGGVYGPNILQGTTRLYTSENGRLVESTIDLPGLYYGEIGVSDIEGDGDLDFFLEGFEDATVATGTRIAIFRNDSGAFVQIVDIRGLIFGGTKWVDYDGNGQMEIVYTGVRFDSSRAAIREIDFSALFPQDD